MKHPAKSRLMWSGVAVACVGLFLEEVIRRGDVFPPWVAALAAALLAPVGVLQAVWKWQDNSGRGNPPAPDHLAAREAEITAERAERARKRQRGSAEPAALGMVILAVVAVLIAMSQCGCASAWPQRCEVDVSGGVSCDCRPQGVVVVHHTVSRTASLECAGEALPVHLDEGVQP